MNQSQLNNIRKQGLEVVSEYNWSQGPSFTRVDECVESIKLYHYLGEGNYSNKVVTLKGIKGMFMIKQDGDLFVYSRIVEHAGGFQVQHLSDNGEIEYLESPAISNL